MWWRVRRFREERARSLEESELLDERMTAVQRNVRLDPELARRELEEMLRQFPMNPTARLFAEAAYTLLGDHEAAITQLAIILGIDPSYYPAHSRLARVLRSKGDVVAAARVLEEGWRHCRRTLSFLDRAGLEEERRIYFGASPAESRQ